MGQALELNLTVLITLLNRERNADIDTRQIIIEDNKKTLGQLIAQLKKIAAVPPETEEALSGALEARNYIAHEFFLRVTEAFENEEARTAAMALLKAKLKQVMVGTAITQGFVHGITKHLKREMSDVLVGQDI